MRIFVSFFFSSVFKVALQRSYISLLLYYFVSFLTRIVVNPKC